MPDIDKLTIQITSDSKSAVAGVEALAKSLEMLKNATKGGLGLSACSKEMQELANSTKKLGSVSTTGTKSAINLWAKFHMVSQAIKKATKVIGASVNKASEYYETVNRFSVSMGEYAAEASEYANKVNEAMGIDPAEWMSNQATFMVLAKGFGIVSDRAYIMSKSLTELGYDIASFHDLSFDDAMKKLQSGFAGELEPLRRIGYDLSVARLQQEAYTLGINKKVSAMTQAEKAELRYYTIMKQSTLAMGDMARTLDSPANQLRIFKAQIDQVSRSIGNIFIPILNKVLPYAIAVTKVIRALADTIASLFGATLPSVKDWDVGSLSSGVDDYSDALGDAAENAKKLKKHTMGFDELNVIDPTSGSGSTGDLGSGGGFNFELPTNEKFLEGITESKIGTIVNEMKEWLGLTEDIDTWSELFNTRLGDILKTVGIIGGSLLLWKLSKSFITSIGSVKMFLDTLGTAATKGFTITGGVVLTIEGIALETTGIMGAIRDGLDGLDFGNIILGGGSITAGGALIGKALGSAIIGSAIGGIVAGVPAFFIGIYDACMNGIDWLSGLLIPAGATATGAGIGAIIGAAGGPIGAGIGAIIGLVVGALTDLIIIIVQNWDKIKEWFAPLGEWFNTYVIQPVANYFSWLWEGISSLASVCWNHIVEWFSPAVNWFSELFGSIFQSISDWFYNIGVIADGCWQLIKIAWGAASSWFNETVIQPVSNFFSTAWEGIKEKAATAWEGIKEVFAPVAEFFETIFSNAWKGIIKVFSIGGEIFVSIKDAVVSAFKFVVNGLIKGINWIIAQPFNAINNVLEWLKEREIAGFKPFKNLKSITVPQIPLLASGGVVSTGQMFIAREAGPEMVGSIGRKTAVVNNEQIVAGIASGVAEANNESNTLLREQNGLLRALLEKESGVYLDGKRLTNSVEKYQSQRGRQIVVGGAL